ncbi:tail terminator [Gordonia phage Syleon]|nr:tail terminator [Gordonia phage Syleon]QGH75750.1 tail terminator [Gordonia phage Syleon]
MAIEFPDWYKGGFPDAEAAVKAILDPFLNQLSPIPSVCAWLPDDYDKYLPVVAIQRVGGKISDDGLTDNPLVWVWVISERRHDSWRLIEYIRQVMRTYCRGDRVVNSAGDVFLIESVSEVQGPELTQTNVPDERVIPVAFALETKKFASTPDYARIRGELF